jgi:hypothetical protein
MSQQAETTSGSKAVRWAGYVVSAAPVLMLIMSAVSKFTKPADVVKGFSDLGWPLILAVPLGILELVCVVLYVIPQTAVLGAILITGYLGGAIATHVRLQEPFLIPVGLGILVWLGLYLRDARLRALIPLRS